jgi:hypothetical protein
LTAREAFAHFVHFRALQMAQFDRDRLGGRAERRASPQELGMSVTIDHLRRRHGFETERLADEPFDCGVDVRIRADCTRQLAHRDRVAR